MATNHYFNNYTYNKNEQELINGLVEEVIQIHGTDVYYIPITQGVPKDMLLGDDPLKKFEFAYMVEIYIETYSEYMGNQDYFSKFGLEIQNELTATISNRAFMKYVGQNQCLGRPREGDLIYIPQLNNVGELYEISFVDQDTDMSMFGKILPFKYKLKLEKYRYNNETINTGVKDIDIIQKNESYNQKFYIKDIFGDIGLFDKAYQKNKDLDVVCSGCVSAYNAEEGWVMLMDIVGDFVENEKIYFDSDENYAIIYKENEYELGQKYSGTYDNNIIHEETVDDVTNNNGVGILGVIK